MNLFPILISSLAFAASVGATTVTVQQETLLIDGCPAKLWGIRVASASQTRELTDQLIANLDDYRSHGVNAIAVYYMGSLGAHSDPFSPDGHKIDAAHQARMDAIIRACDERGMVALVGIFYQRVDQPHLADWTSAQNAVRTVADALRQHRNVILNIANEQGHDLYAKTPWKNVQNPHTIVALCREAKAIDPARIVGGGGYDHANNEIIGRAPEADVLLFDTGLESSAALHARFRAAGVRKPMINVEIFGAWTKQFQPPGVFPEAAKREHRREVDEGAATPGLHIFLHSSPWFQGTAEPRQPMRFDLGGDGTATSPGVRWFFDHLAEAVPEIALGGAIPPNPHSPRRPDPGPKH